jgi:hypothetical protein
VEERKVFVIVADAVQTHLQDLRDFRYPGHRVLAPTDNTRTVIQSRGRIAAQVGHVVSHMRLMRFAKVCDFRMQTALREHKSFANGVSKDLSTDVEQVYTIIILSVPDSYQLRFRRDLLEKLGLHVYSFYDEYPSYGEGQKVCTAICTGPIDPELTGNALDYLSLWR